MLIHSVEWNTNNLVPLKIDTAFAFGRIGDRLLVIHVYPFISLLKYIRLTLTSRCKNNHNFLLRKKQCGKIITIKKIIFVHNNLSASHEKTHVYEISSHIPIDSESK